MRLAPTVMPLSSSTYNAIELKSRGREQVRKTPQLFYLTGNLGEEETSPLRGTPPPPLPAWLSLPREAEAQNEVCRVQMPPFRLSLNPDD